MKLQKRLAADIMKCSPYRVRFDSSRLGEIKEAITKVDVSNLIKKGAIGVSAVRGTSRVRARKTQAQRRKGRQKGHGSRKGGSGARVDSKKVWINRVRAQRALLRRLKSRKIVLASDFRLLYRRVKGGFFRSVRHIKGYIEEHGMVRGNGKE